MENTNTIFNGIRIVELARYMAAPLGSRTLAAMGAEVIKVESAQVPEIQRLDADGTMDGYRWPDFAALKKCISLNLRYPEALAVLKELLKISDILVDNFLPNQSVKIGLDYDELRSMNPRLIIMRQPGLGLTGPYRNFVAYGMPVQALGGLYDTTGEPGTPMCPNFSHPDYISGFNSAIAQISALDYRRRTGKGQVIELPLYMSMASFIGSAGLEYTANGNGLKGMGNRDRYMSPHNAYKCKGDDRWCVIAVTSDDEWESLCKVIGNPDWSAKPAYKTVAGRKKDASAIDRHIGEWTSTRLAEDVFEMLQNEGVPAGYVAKGSDLLSDPHLKERGYFQTTPNHPRYGSHPNYSIPAIKFSETPCMFGPPPKLGEHNDYVYRELLGMDEAEIRRLTEKGVFV